MRSTVSASNPIAVFGNFGALLFQGFSTEMELVEADRGVGLSRIFFSALQIWFSRQAGARSAARHVYLIPLTRVRVEVFPPLFVGAKCFKSHPGWWGEINVSNGAPGLRLPTKQYL